MSHYKPYPAYKDSGVEWLGDLPTHWSVKPLKWVGTYQNSNVDKKSYEGQAQVRLCNYTDVYNNEFIVDSMDFMVATASATEIASMAVKKGDIIITKDSEDPTDIGIPALVAEDLGNVVCGYHLTVIRVPESYQGFIFRLIQSDPTKARFYVESPGITRYGLNQDAIGGLPLVLPPPREAEKLASYVDSETARIDALITKKTRFIELLREKRQALITHAVTKGLDSNVKMKDSGVEWLGEVPEHWDVCRLRRILSDSTYGISESLSDFGAVGVLRMGDIQNGEVLTDNLGFVPEVEDSLLLHKGDLVFNRTNSLEKIGKVGLVRSEPESPLSFASYLVRFRPQKGVFEEYLHYFLNSSYAGAFSRAEAIPAIGQANLNPEKYSYMFLVVPPEDEQRAIVAFVKIEVARLDSLIDKSERSIELLKERRSALITSAVTGQIDLREAA